MGQTEQVTKSQPSMLGEIEANQERRKMFLGYANRGWLVLGIVTLLTLPFFPDRRSEFGLLAAITLPSYLLVRFLNHSGRTRLAGSCPINPGVRLRCCRRGWS